jgi:hypothetical protein
MKHRVKIVGFAVLLALIFLVALAPAALADPAAPIAGAEGHGVSYTCPFAHTLALADFDVWQTTNQFAGGGWGVFQAPAFGVDSRVSVKLVRVEGNHVYFAGTVTGRASWWYFAAEAGSFPSSGKAVGVYVNGKSAAMALVAAASDLTDRGGGFQPLLSGSVSIW